MSEQPAGDDTRRSTPTSTTPALRSPVVAPTGSHPASASSSRHSSTVRRTNSKRRSIAAGIGSIGTPPPVLRQRSSDLGEDDAALTSFPSLSPEASPNLPRRKSKTAAKKEDGTKTGKASDAEATPRQAPRMNLVETLMSRTNTASARGRDALFADSPATTAQDVPGALHHASDDHIRRLVARRGAVMLVRQLAGDLAQREAEMTTLRLRAEARERELKRMLREVEVGNLDIERRLHGLEVRDKAEEGKIRSNRNSLGSVGDLVGEAIGDSLDSRDEETFLTEATTGDNQATLRATAPANADAESLSSSVESGKKQGWMNYFLGSSSTVRKRGASSPSGQSGHEPAYKTASAVGRRKGLDDTTFKPLVAEDEDARDTSMTRVASRASDVSARRVSKSSWTLKLFAGNNSGKDGEPQPGRGRSSTTASDATKSIRDVSRDSKHTTASGTVKNTGRGKRQSLQTINTGIPINSDTRSTNSNAPLVSPGSFEPSQNIGPVEMDAILPHGSRPPTLSPQETANLRSDVLTDRFGFIYDQRRRKKEAEAIAKSKGTDSQMNQETIGNPFDISVGGDNDPVGRSSTPASFNDVDDAAADDAADGADSTNQSTRKWQDYLKFSTFSTELLSQTPAPASVTVVEASSGPPAKRGLKRVPTFGDDANVTSPNPVPSTSTITAGKAEIAKPVLGGPSSPSPPQAPGTEVEPVKLLLAQLGELHDKLQREKTVRWNEFMRKVRAEQRRRQGETAGKDEARSKSDLPEAQIADGEIIGIASLGHKGKTGRAKYREFRALVLAGIPVAHRAKVWSECSGANALRIPGYYHELVEGQVHADPAVLSQIEMDINRTLTDNVFFRSGPGVAKLNEILLAYARRNPEVGYCQGMNMITASLLLMMPTSEDVFWILASLIEGILPMHYYDNSLLASRADQQVLRSYVSELLPRLGQHLDEMGVELEALTFQWFLSLFTACLSAEALYRVWDVLICLNQDPANGGSTFLFQVALALLKLNETQLLACETPGEVYAYLGGEITNHAISIDGLIRASEGLKALVKRNEVEERRKKWVEVEEETIRERERIRSGTAVKSKASIAVGA